VTSRILPHARYLRGLDDRRPMGTQH
jgi:hypothetical protein